MLLIIPYGVRTRVFALKKQCPRPLDERDFVEIKKDALTKTSFGDFFSKKINVTSDLNFFKVLKFFLFAYHIEIHRKFLNNFFFEHHIERQKKNKYLFNQKTLCDL